MMGRPTYRVRDWEKHFECSQSKRNSRPLGWIAVPTRHDGKGFRRVMRLPNGPALYGAWVILLQVAAKCPTRGVLADEDGPLDADDLSVKTDCPAELFEEALKVLSDPKIGWITVDQSVESLESSPGVRGENSDSKQGVNGQLSENSPSALGDHSESAPPTGQDRTGQDVTEQDKTGPAGAPASEETSKATGKSTSKRRKWSPADIVLEDLTDNTRLLKLHKCLTNFKCSGFTATDASEQRTFALAERALEVASEPYEGEPANPPRFFVNDLKKRWWDRITAAQEDRGCRRWKEVRHPKLGPAPDFVTAGSAKLAAAPLPPGEGEQEDAA